MLKVSVPNEWHVVYVNNDVMGRQRKLTRDT